MIPRTLTNIIIKNHQPGFIDVIYGPRRIGKTVLLEQLKQKLSKSRNLLSLNGDTQEGRATLSTTSEVKLSQLISPYNFVFIDEAQRIPNINLALKILIDRFPNKFIVVTGSSSLELSSGMRENLTGRNKPYVLFPLSAYELSKGLSIHEVPSLLEYQLVFGSYPYLTSLSTGKQKQEYLENITSDYLFKDILLLQKVENPDNLKKLATLLSFQIGNLVSLNELSNTLRIDIKTVSRYLHLLEQSFIIFRVGSYSKNLRRELTKSNKYYFFDLGIRNALTHQFLPLESRIDTGALWENFLFAERQKRQQSLETVAQYFFWRNYEGAEIDMIECRDDIINPFEFKWQEKKSKTPKHFLETYHLKAKLVNRQNYLDFILPTPSKKSVEELKK